MSVNRAVIGHQVQSTPSLGGQNPFGSLNPAYERRSRTRPQVVQRWQKTILPPGGQATSLKACKIDIWIARTEAILKSQSTLKLLTADDWNGFGRHQVPAAHDSAIAARILLRLGLSRAVGFRIVPSKWDFNRTAYGRLMLSKNAADLNFSVSHVDDIVAVAVTCGANLGFDLENVNRHLSSNVFANFLHPHERAALEPLSHYEKIREFIRLWTIKEAYTKSLGLGHSIDFASLNCVEGAICDANTPDVRSSHLVECFFASVGCSLYHASLAVNTNTPNVVPVELQMINVLAPGESQNIGCAPSCK